MKNHSSSNYKLMYLLYLTSISLILPYILQTHFSLIIHTYFPHIFLIYLTNTISHKIYISYHLHTSWNISNTLSRTFYQKSFSWKAYNYNAKNPSYERYKLIILKTLLMEGNITYIWLKIKKALHKENLSVW